MNSTTRSHFFCLNLFADEAVLKMKNKNVMRHYGCTPGSTVGPLQFLLNINDLPNCLELEKS